MPDDAAPEDDPELAEVIRLELMLLAPKVRSDPAAVRQLLDRQFVEFEASGRTWDAEQIAGQLERDPGSGVLRATELKATRLGPDVVLLTYLVSNGPACSRRSSVWRRPGGGGWRLFFHQGTPLPA